MCLCFGIAMFSVGYMYYSYCEDKKTHISTNRPYKEYYTVYRPDDPRIERLRQEWYKNGAPTMTSTKLD